MRRRRFGVIIAIASLSASAAGGRVGALPLPPPLESTTTTIIPIWVLLDVSPDSGPPGSLVSVHGAGCVYGATAVDVTLSALDQPDVPLDSAHVVPDGNGAWSTRLAIPTDAVVGGPPYAVNARCSQPTTTIFYYQPASVAVMAENATSSTTTSSSTPTTTAVIAGVVSTLAPSAIPTTAPVTASPSAMLPRTGAGSAPGLTLLAVSLVAAGSLLVLSRHRSRRVCR